MSDDAPLTAVNVHPDRRRAAMVAANWACQSDGCRRRAGYTAVHPDGAVTVHCGRHAAPTFLAAASDW